MALLQEPFLNLSYNETYQSQGWNVWNDENIISCSFYLSATLDGEMGSPPGAMYDGAFTFDGALLYDGAASDLVDGRTYLVSSPAAGDWVGQEGKLATVVEDGWKFYSPVVGQTIFNTVDESFYLNTGDGFTNKDDYGVFPSPSVSCAYPLDDDGSTAALLGYVSAGPATGPDLQTMSYTTSGSVKHILCATDVLTTANFAQPVGNDVAVEAVVTQQGTTVCSLVIAVIAEGGSVTVATLDAVADGDVLAFTVTPSGVVSAYVNGVYTLPTGFVSVGATDKFAFWLAVDGMPSGQSVIMTLRTNASDMTGTYPAGTTDICGNTL